MRGWSGKTAGSGSASSSSTSSSSRAGSSTLPARWAVTSRYAPGLHAVILQRRRALRGDRCEGQRHVRHHVAHELHRAVDALALEVRHGGRSGAESRSLAWSVSTRLSSSGIERSQERMPASTCASGTLPTARRRARPPAWSWCRRRPAPCRAAVREHAAPAPRACARSAPVVPRADAQLAVGRGHAQLVEEDPRELVVVVLAGVDEQLLVALAQPARDRCGLYELRPVTDDRDDSHVWRGSNLRRTLDL